MSKITDTKYEVYQLHKKVKIDGYENIVNAKLQQMFGEHKQFESREEAVEAVHNLGKDEPYYRYEVVILPVLTIRRF